MWGVSLPRPMLLPVGTFSYTPCAGLCGDYLFYVGTLLPAHHVVLHGEFFLNSSCCSMWGVSLIHPMLFYVESFSYTPLAIWCGKILLHVAYYFMWWVSLTSPIQGFFLLLFFLFFLFFFFWEMSLRLSVLFYVGVSLTLLVLFYTGSIFSMPYDIWYQEFLLHILCKFMWRHFQIVCTVFFRVKSFFDTPHAILCWTFLLEFDVQYTSLSGEFFLHTPC